MRRVHGVKGSAIHRGELQMCEEKKKKKKKKKKTGNPHRKVWLNLQKSAEVIVPVGKKKNGREGLNI